MSNAAAAGTPPQPDLFAAHDPAPHTPERMAPRVRPRLLALLAEARAAARMPWPPREAETKAMLFHNMANWLPEAEREALRAAFRAEMERLAAAAAAGRAEE